ncbi:MAG: helix-turn-helix domain-containing protein [Actinomycetota bacterium]|nr:helix-turn-helix domain-containing protein [Actinomycetota bacterium]
MRGMQVPAPGLLSRFRKDYVEQAFTAEQACRLSNCTHHQLRYWDRVGLVSPSLQATGGRPGVRRLYSFRDLVALRVVRSLLDNGMSLQRVRRAWDYLRREGDMENHLSDVKLVTDGLSIFRVSSDDGELMDALREGQLAFFVAIDEIAREVEEDVSHFELDRDSFLTMLRRVEDDVNEERQTGT